MRNSGRLGASVEDHLDLRMVLHGVVEVENGSAGRRSSSIGT
jgi:hypothetical protein